MGIQIKPVKFFRFILIQVHIGTIPVTLGSNAQISVSVLDQGGTSRYDDVIPLEGADYKEWGPDDSYVVKFVLSKLELEQA